MYFAVLFLCIVYSFRVCFVVLFNGLFINFFILAFICMSLVLEVMLYKTSLRNSVTLSPKVGRKGDI